MVENLKRLFRSESGTSAQFPSARGIPRPANPGSHPRSQDAAMPWERRYLGGPRHRTPIVVFGIHSVERPQPAAADHFGT